jgi:hypothetical protein
MMYSDPAGWKAEHDERTRRLRCFARRRPTSYEPHASRPAPVREGPQMDTHSAAARFEAALSQQLAMAGDPAVEAAGKALQATLAPATRQLAMELAEQAASEVAAQLPEHEVDVVLRDGEPSVVVRAPAERTTHAADEDLQARITLRLPPSLKAMIEESAGDVGDSVNTFVLKTLSARAARAAAGGGRRVQGTVQT